ncbi:Probable serine/threonine-protein kinase At1g54610 [Linum grandiflorum]
MGASQGKYPSISPTKGQDKLKVENGLRRKINGEHRRSLGPHHHRNSGRKGEPRPPMRTYTGGGGSGGGGGNEGDDPFKGSSDPFGVEETVDGWPKWLADNVPREVLAAVVKKSAEDYDKLDKVGSGTYSNVYKARDRDTDKIVALKKVRFDTSEPESIKFMAREIMILQKLDHPNVVKLEGIATSRLQYSLYLVFDFMQTDLQTVIDRIEISNMAWQVKSYMQQLLSGLQHCHDRGILHRDIKGANLLIDKHGMLKIADFGLANYYYYYSTKRKRPLTSRVVTLWYRAPELLLGSTDYGVGIDLWSAGCLMAEMFAGRPIMPGRTEVEQLHRIFKLCGTPSEDYWKKLGLSTTFRPPQVYKPNLIRAFRDFPESSFGLFTTLLALDPDYRGSASSALNNQFFYSTPLACDLSGLPVIRNKEDEEADDQRKHRARRTGNNFVTKIERFRVLILPKRMKRKHGWWLQDPEMVNLQQVEAGRNATSSSNSSGMKSESPPPPPPPPLLTNSPVDLSKQDRPPTRNISGRNKSTKNLPPLPFSKTSSIRNNTNNDMYRFRAAVQRSASSREYTKLQPRKHVELYATEE